jgi:hypothetical protein
LGLCTVLAGEVSPASQSQRNKPKEEDSLFQRCAGQPKRGGGQASKFCFWSRPGPCGSRERKGEERHGGRTARPLAPSPWPWIADRGENTSKQRDWESGSHFTMSGG